MVTLNKLLVAAYKLAGFAVLTAILGGTASYIGMQLFYFVSNGWVTPVIIASSDDRVLRAQAQLEQQISELDRLRQERTDLRNQLSDAERRLTVEQRFLQRFGVAMQQDMQQRRQTLESLQGLAARYASLAPLLDIADPNVAARTADHAATLLSAHIIDEADFLDRNARAARLAQSHLNLTESQIALRDRLQTLQTELQALNAHSDARAEAQTYSVLLLRREFERAQLEEQRLRANREALQQRSAALDERLGRQQVLVAALADSPYLRAMARHATMAFAPYANVQRVEPGTPVYGCAVGPLWCTQVGQVTQILDGEVTGHHPLNNDELRGVLIDLQLDGTWARRPVLHLRHTPFFT